MNIEKKELITQTKPMCKACRQFYGNQIYEGMCSTCFKQVSSNQRKKKSQDVKSKHQKLQNQKEPTPSTLQLNQQMQKITIQPVQVDRNRCAQCKKKIGALGIQCRCKLVFCNGHRLPEYHNCTFDHLSFEKEKLKKQIVKVYHRQISETQ